MLTGIEDIVRDESFQVKLESAIYNSPQPSCSASKLGEPLW